MKRNYFLALQDLNLGIGHDVVLGIVNHDLIQAGREIGNVQIQATPTLQELTALQYSLTLTVDDE
jgi:hypothetical protein